MATGKTSRYRYNVDNRDNPEPKPYVFIEHMGEVQRLNGSGR